jgi:hypothetical protein
MEVSGQIHAVAISLILLGKEPLQCPLNSKLGGPQSQSGCFGKEKNILLLLASEPWFVKPVA